MKKARFVSMIILAASVVVTSALAVENIVLACLDLARRRHWGSPICFIGTRKIPGRKRARREDSPPGSPCPRAFSAP